MPVISCPMRGALYNNRLKHFYTYRNILSTVKRKVDVSLLSEG